MSSSETQPASTGDSVPPNLGTSGAPSPDTTDKSRPQASKATSAIHRASISSRALNPRSCNTCRRRKVKCDKQEGGCGNCAKAHSECVYPGPGRAPRRPKNGIPKGTSERETELLKRLRRLEGVVEELSGQVELENIRAGPEGAKDSAIGDDETLLPKKNAESIVRVVGMDEGLSTIGAWNRRLIEMGGGPPRVESIDNEFGKLLLDEGKSRYVSNSFWARFHGEVENIRELFQEDEPASEEEEEADSSPGAASLIPSVPDIYDHHNFVMGYSSSGVDLRPLHPLPSQILFYWETFKENVDPLCKIMHIPTMTKTMNQVKLNLGCLSRSTEALCFAIYFATVTSMSDEEVKQAFAVEKTFLLNKYRFGVEQALAKASFLQTSEIVTLQAFVLFLVCVRRSDETKFVWTLTGLAIRIALSLGLHRDGTNFELTPFDTEMRRRCWWQICVLDIRSSEDYGSDPSILEFSYDTQFPLNINDEDLDPQSIEMPLPRLGLSEQTFCLIRYEICATTRKLNYMPPGNGPCKSAFTSRTLEDKETIVKDLRDRVEAKYLVHCQAAGPLYWVAATVARLVVAKMGLVIYSPHLSEGLPQSIKDHLFIASIEIMEYSQLLETENSTKKWSWLFHTYVQWHAIAYILGEVIVRPSSNLIDRGWKAVDGVFNDWDDAIKHSKNGMLWAPMRKLMAKARKKRESDMEVATVSTNEHQVSRTASPRLEKIRQANFEELKTMSPIFSKEIETPVSDHIPPLYPMLQYGVASPGAADVQIGSYISEQQHMHPQVHTPMQSQAVEPQSRPWILDDSALHDLDMNGVTGDGLSEGWDDLISYFQMDPETSDPNARGAPYGGMGYLL